MITFTAPMDVHAAIVNLMTSVRGLTDKVTQADQMLTAQRGQENSARQKPQQFVWKDLFSDHIEEVREASQTG